MGMFDLLRLPSPHHAADGVDWSALRRPPRHSDEALTGTTRAWLRRLPPGRRPQRLCCRFPRVANRIAWCWPDPKLTRQVFDDLLEDRRGRREGFPRAIVAELRRLRDFNDRQRTEGPAAGFWDALRRKPSEH
jgi:hypothetical protein